MEFPTTVTITPTNGSYYTWGSADFPWAAPDATRTWDTAYPISYALNVEEGWSASEDVGQQYTLTPHEGWRTAELWSQVFAQIISESWMTNECWTDIWQPMLRVYDSWIMSDGLANSATIPQAAGWRTEESSSRAPVVNPQEGWQTAEDWRQQYQLSPQEGWVMVELAAREFSRTLEESLNVTDRQPVWNAILAVCEAWNNGETMNHVWLDFLNFVESWTTSETPQNEVTKPLFDSLRTADRITKATQKVILEACHIAETLKTENTFQRAFAEALRLVESLSHVQIKAVREVLNLDDAYLRNANAVISDLAFASGDLTLDKFVSAISAPVGYGAFTDFIPGELEYQKALVALVLAGPLTTGRPQVTEWKLTVDVPDRTDSGTRSIPASTTFILFKVRFFAPPEVIVQLRGGSTGTPDITGITDAGFYLQILGANGQPVAGDVVWSAVGY
ncbi:hypothetical protein [Anaeroselena agilis]|uniref:Uncharacterized protein n=1 Tax=Anaeroselena agilis TaxID=3063788 RepID=A0ABU3NTD4_9FIRM|nr:hypothetical protein [Selenomonadales bacterium 4137-cl]